MRAMILAAGLGTRMAPLTDTVPKPLLRAGGRSLIEWQIRALVQAGIRDIVVNHHHLGQQIERALGDGSQLGARLHYSPETVRLETAGGIIKALPLLDDDWFVVVNADVWTDFDYSTFLPISSPASNQTTNLHPQLLAHLILVPNAPHHPAGDFFLGADGLLSASEELAQRQAAVTGAPLLRYTFSGISLLNRRLFENLPASPRPLAPLLIQAMEAGQVSGALYEGQWWDIGTPQRLEALDRHLRDRAARE